MAVSQPSVGIAGLLSLEIGKVHGRDDKGRLTGFVAADSLDRSIGHRFREEVVEILEQIGNTQAHFSVHIKFCFPITKEQKHP